MWPGGQRSPHNATVLFLQTAHMAKIVRMQEKLGKEFRARFPVRFPLRPADKGVTQATRTHDRHAYGADWSRDFGYCQK